MSELAYVERPPADVAEGLLVLHHGRGSNEQDLIGLADVFDPERRLHVVSPRAPLEFQGMPGAHWYVVQRVGFPHAETFLPTLKMLNAFHDSLYERTGVGPERTILGGFSQGSVMSFATGLSGDRPAPAGILGISGFIPGADDWTPDFASRPDMPILIAHGRRDPVITFDFAEQARDLIEAAGLPLTFMPSDAGHNIDPPQVPGIVDWISSTLN
jgi:phospholipase/carboxylesterase